MPIGVFDSGVGGLTVIKSLLKALPHENFIYLGDTARTPYGSRSADTIKKYTEEDIKYIQSYGGNCNTTDPIQHQYLHQ